MERRHFLKITSAGTIAGLAGVKMIMPDNSGRDPELSYN